MKLRVYTPSDIFLDREVKKVVAESPAGFCILPRHVDYVTALTTGILLYLTRKTRNGFWRSTRAFWSNWPTRFGGSGVGDRGRTGRAQAEH